MMPAPETEGAITALSHTPRANEDGPNGGNGRAAGIPLGKEGGNEQDGPGDSDKTMEDVGFEGGQYGMIHDETKEFQNLLNQESKVETAEGTDMSEVKSLLQKLN